MSDAFATFQADIQALETRRADLETLKTQAIASATTPDFAENLARVYDTEINAVQYAINLRKIEYASSLL